jgi:CheY-like chemotaxis protein
MSGRTGSSDKGPADADHDLQRMFGAELDARLSSMEAALLELSAAAGERARHSAVDALLRDAHSLKGAAQMIGQREVVRIAQVLEARLEGIRSTTPAKVELDQLREDLGSLRAADSRYAGSPQADGPTNPPGRRRALRVLVADDSITARAFEEKVLSAAGYEVVVACDGEDALRVLREEQIDLLVSDIDMPRLDGLALTRRIRQDTRLQQLPVLLISGVEDPGVREAAVEARADAFLAKNALEETHLLDVIQGLLA